MTSKNSNKKIKYKKFIFAFLITAMFAIISAFATSLSFAIYFKNLPDVSVLENYQPDLSSKIFSDKGEIIAHLGTQKRILVPLKEIPKKLIQATIATEDASFYKHKGINAKGILRAVFTDVLAGKIVEGGSSITQQLAKQLFLTNKRTFDRKLKELILALQIEKKYSKDEILEIYFNQIYFGEGAYGVETASILYFGKSVKYLNLSECALLAGLPKAPTNYSPFKYPNKAKKRQILVAKRMLENGFISKKDFEIIKKSSFDFSKFSKRLKYGAHFVEYIRQYLETKYDFHLIYSGGLKIYTTLNFQMQQIAEDVFKNNLDQLKKSIKKDDLQGSFIAIEPKTGQIKTMIGGYEFSSSNQFNRAIQAKRQPGSSFKVFVYLTALDNGFTPASIFLDAPVVFKGAQSGQDWTPTNYEEDKFYGYIGLRKALAHSVNIVAIKLLEKVVPDRVIEYAQGLGVKSSLGKDLSLALGTYEVSNLEMTSAYATIANQGIYIQPFTILKIEDRNGKVLEKYVPEEKIVLSPETTYLMTSLMESAVKEGTCWKAKALNRPVAAKTGTTDNFTDAWFLGFTPQLAAGVWIGFDKKEPIGYGMTGGMIAAPIWVEFMQKALQDKPVLDFPIPENIISVAIDEKTGLLANSFCQNVTMEVFKKGTEPQNLCKCKKNKSK
ncbi:MAG: PBP1A family penicillin-binding protein [bacterium]